MDRIVFEVPGGAVPFARAGSAGKRRFTPRRQADYMAAVRLFASRAMDGRVPLAGPVEMTVCAEYIAPASWSRRKREAAIWRTGRPDIDNLAKIVADSINGICFIDDAQVAQLNVRNIYGPLSRTIVSVAPIVSVGPNGSEGES